MINPSRSAAFHGLFWFVTANIVLLVLSGFGYLANAPAASALGWIFLRAALIAQLATAALLIAVVLASLIWLIRPRHSPTALAPIAALLFVALHFFVFLDRKQYALFRFHLNGLAINLLSSRAGWESMHVTSSDVALVVSGLVAALLVEAFAFRCLLRRFATASPTPRVVRRWAMLILPVLVLGVGERATYAWADLRNVRDITRETRVIPLYQPLTVRHIAQRVFGLQINHETTLAAPKSGGSLAYPRVPLRFHSPSHRPNILWLTLDSWRYDAFSRENTPQIYDFAASAQVFQNHLSGGNATRDGVFSMFYGIHGSYWQPVLAERRGPVVITRLKELGYKMNIEASTSLTWPEFRRTAFVEIPTAIQDNMPGPSTRDRDRQLVEHLENFLDCNQRDRPFFAWLFFDSSHHPYDFEKSAVRFQPYDGRPGITNLDALRNDAAARQRQHNRYRNAVAYLDGLVARAINDIAERDLLRNTIIIITGDHGEEFFEHGYFGHNGAFTPEQIHVPLIFYDPSRTPARVSRMTSHEDLAPTLLEMLGVENPPGDYSLGHPLFSGTGEPFAVSCGWSECAVIDARGYTIFGTQTYHGIGLTVLDPNYKEIDDPRAELRLRTPELSQVMREMSAFLK